MTTLDAKVRATLEAFWDARALPVGPGGSSIVDALVAPVESMTAVEVLLDIDPIVGRKLPSSVIQAGGYMSREEFVDKLSAKIFKYLEDKS
ncbi:hypothetical protein [Burkholderia ubonensis]|uniref:hypothetical protein n=1 Tax=Burkholderia ubonensis TaxID=101571 RepID=UPI0007C8069C|nr:hypothetical protein [Burkholderia ubonensis]